VRSDVGPTQSGNSLTVPFAVGLIKAGFNSSTAKNLYADEFRVNRSPISRETDHRFHPKAITVFTRFRSLDRLDLMLMVTPTASPSAKPTPTSHFRPSPASAHPDPRILVRYTVAGIGLRSAPARRHGPHFY
jgi:hypothetical protein